MKKSFKNLLKKVCVIAVCFTLMFLSLPNLSKMGNEFSERIEDKKIATNADSVVKKFENNVSSSNKKQIIDNKVVEKIEDTENIVKVEDENSTDNIKKITVYKITEKLGKKSSVSLNDWRVFAMDENETSESEEEGDEYATTYRAEIEYEDYDEDDEDCDDCDYDEEDDEDSNNYDEDCDEENDEDINDCDYDEEDDEDSNNYDEDCDEEENIFDELSFNSFNVNAYTDTHSRTKTCGGRNVLYVYVKYDAFDQEAATWTKINKIKEQVKSTPNTTTITGLTGVVKGSCCYKNYKGDIARFSAHPKTKNYTFKKNRNLQSKSVSWSTYHRADGSGWLGGMFFKLKLKYYNQYSAKGKKYKGSTSLTVYAD